VSESVLAAERRMRWRWDDYGWHL